LPRPCKEGTFPEGGEERSCIDSGEKKELRWERGGLMKGKKPGGWRADRYESYVVGEKPSGGERSLS